MDAAPNDTGSSPKIVALTGTAIGVAAVFAPSFLVFRPNRLFAGEAAGALDALGGWAWVLVALWVLTLLGTLAPRLGDPVRGALVGAAGGAVAVLALWGAGVAATAYSLEMGEVARVSFGAAFWFTMLAAYVAIYAASAWVTPGWRRTLMFAVPVGGALALLASGELSALSLLREYANARTEFAAQLQQHVAYILGATGGGIVLGVPLGLLAARRPRTEPAVFATLNVFNVLPVLAFVGLLNPVLTWLSTVFPILGMLGVRAVGWAPVILVLTAYATYPIARNTYTALVTLDPSVLDAASGIGMGRWRRVFEVELPLAAPVLMAGIRIALVQTSAGAIIAGLIGGGGLGMFVFLGASQTAIDLVLLGTIPIVALGLFFDRLTLLVQRAISPWSEAR